MAVIDLDQALFRSALQSCTAEALRPNYFEWDAVMDETTPVEEWARLLPLATLVVSDPNTAFPIREITAILRLACSMWTYKEIAGGGHMAPITRPDVINPLVGSFLRSQPSRFQPSTFSAHMNEEEIAVSRSRRGAQLIL